LLGVTDGDIVFLGDALFAGGNDEPAKKTGVDYIQVDGPDQALEILKQYI
jgi:glyoxylase-like metal-dependent hydrolase (beta-lactamase superfamily II)